MGMLTPGEIGGLEFHSRETLFGGWYMADEVDEALEDIERTVRGLRGMALSAHIDVSDAMTSNDIHGKTFRTVVRPDGVEWYSARQVDSFLDECSQAVWGLSMSTMPIARERKWVGDGIGIERIGAVV